MKKKTWSAPKLSLKKMTIAHLSNKEADQVKGGATLTHGCVQPTSTVQHTRFDCSSNLVC